MKRKMAFLLAVVLIVSTGFMAFATGTDNGGQTLPETGQSVPGIQTGENSGENGGLTDVQGSPSPETETVEIKENHSESGATPNSEATAVPSDTSVTPNPEATVMPSDTSATSVPEATAVPSASGTPQTSGATQMPGTTTATPAPNATQKPIDAGAVLSGDAGQVDVSISAALDLDCAVAFDITLTDGVGFNRSGNIVFPEKGEGKKSTSFEGLPKGTYTLTVTAPRFADYTQEIEVAGKAYTIELATGFLAGEGIKYTDGSAHPGILVIGDVDGDGDVDEDDREALVDFIDSGEQNSRTDLNGDGTTNLLDLEYFAKTYHDTRDMQATIMESVPRAAVLVKTEAGTQVEGSLEDLLKNDGSVILKPANSGAISATNVVELQFDFANAAEVVETDGIVIETGKGNAISEAEFTVVYEENGIEREFSYQYAKPGSAARNGLEELDESTRAEIDGNGNILLHLGTQIAVKRVTITILGMESNNNLAEISKVEFLNGMENRIPEPELDIPTGLTAKAGNKLISLEWDGCNNVTGYEVEISNGSAAYTTSVTGTKLDIASFGRDELVNYTTYSLRVRSVNGTWRSEYGSSVTAKPEPAGRPDTPDMVKATGGYKQISVSWKKMEDTQYYRLFYKKDTDAQYQEIGQKLTANSYLIEGLEDLTAYSIYVIGGNEKGESGPSLTVNATTTDLMPAVMPKYKLINTGEAGQKGAHIISATMLATNINSMVDSLLDEQQGTAWGTVDHDPVSYYLRTDWDDGGYNIGWDSRGLTYEFDQVYKMDTISLYTFNSQDEGLAYARARYWDENGTVDYRTATIQTKRDKQNRVYYSVKLASPVNAKKIQLYLGRGSSNTRRMSVAEVYFHYYDSIFDDIMALYEDDLHTVLKTGVTQETIDVLRTRIQTPDEVSKEYHPDSEMLERELKTAEDILNAAGLSEPVRVHNTITTNDAGRGFSGLNAWQPLGVTAAAQEQIVVYVGHNTRKTGDSTNLQLVATQYNAEANSMSKVIGTLKVGANEITVPKIWSQNFESGGALYVQYTSNNANDQYSVRVSGGMQVPILDLYQVTDPAKRLEKTTAYVKQLETYVSNIEENHKKYHQESDNALVNQYTYDAQTCILGASDIMLDTMMFSLPAQQIWAGSGSDGTSVEARAQRILASMDSMEEMMYLFYQHKGLNKTATDAIDRIPAGHQNIRYQRMFAKAFMYASGNHIGIGWGSTSGMVASPGVVIDSSGKYVSGSYFGWGIAHEIGHCINQGAYTVAEITNNYFAVLAQAKETNDSVRFKYRNVYDKVTSGAKGRASNVFTQLGLYWQLHLAYDNGYNYKTYEDYNEQFNSLFFARVDTYARTPSKAPAPDGVALTLSGEEQNLMRLSCAAAEKNLLDFFERWGMTPDETTQAYAKQFEKETRAIYYGNDEARAYRLQHSGSSLGTDGTKEAVNATAVLKAANQVGFSLSYKDIPEADVLGYEIVRCTISGGKVERNTVGFVEGSSSSFTDTIATMNNRVVYYEITLIDKYLNRSAAYVTNSFKIEHGGNLDKSSWTVSTQNLAVEGETEDGSAVLGDATGCEEDKEEKDETAYVREKDKLIDNDMGTVYTATASGASQITVDFNKTLTVAGFKVTGEKTLGCSYQIEVCSGGIWRTVAEGTLTEAVQTIHFANSDGKYVSTYAATAARLSLNTSAGSKVSISEVDVLGPTGDNVDFRRTGDSSKTVVIGKLSDDFKFGEKDGDVIPKGSIVFAGSYKGNAAYNVVMLYDQSGKVVGSASDGKVESDQIILSDVPAEGNILNVSDGIWIYWLKPGTDVSAITKVRAELYRVNKAETNEGQRLVSDSLFEEMPEVLPEVSLESAAAPWK